MKLVTIYFCLTVTVLLLVSSNASALQDWDKKDEARSVSTKVNRVVSIIVTNKNGRQGAYELSDSTINGEKRGDNIIDFANVIKELSTPDRGAESQIPPGTKYPIKVKFSYFRPGNEISSYSSLRSEEEWFSGFYGKVMECYDADGNPVFPVSGEWKPQKATEKFMRDLQRMYYRYR